MNEFRCDIRCDICGRFIALDEFEQGSAYSTFHPELTEPYALASESTTYKHTCCAIRESVSSSG